MRSITFFHSLLLPVYSSVFPVGRTVFTVLKLPVFLAVSLLFCHQIAAVEIQTGAIDQRQYHYQVLDNQLRILLISDREADKAAASMNVNVGSYNDPADRQGLAHFLEHMLFLGTKKYPEADEYQSFISNHGGTHNAWTSRHHTNYFFDINADQLDPALDRFAQFFIAPLFDGFYVDRERNAVYSEFQASIRDDYRRSYDVYSSVINPDHPDAGFSVGNLETLADRPEDRVRDDLLAFYQKHYSAHEMALVVLGKESIEELKKQVIPRFNQIPVSAGAVLAKKVSNKDSSPSVSDTIANSSATPTVPLFTEGRLPLEAVIEPVKELRQMQMSFDLPGVQKYYNSKPLDFIAHLLGHEGRGSLLALLKAEGLAESLSAGGFDRGDDTSRFSITLHLTESGLQQREKVRALVFHYLRLIAGQGLQPWRFDEKRLLSRTAFEFREKGSAIDTVKTLANNFFRYPPEAVISGSYAWEIFDPQLIRDFLSMMTPDRVFISTLMTGVTTDKVSRWYQTPYAVRTVTADLPLLDDTLLSGLSLPEPNPFIPESIDLYQQDPILSSPKQLSSGNINLWAKQDISYGTPKVKVQLRINSPRVSGKLDGVVLHALYVDLLRDSLARQSYPALLAGASLSLRAHNRGLDVTLEGYHDKLHHLMDLFVNTVESNDFDPERFTRLKADLLRRWRNNDKKTPYRQLYNQLVVNLYDLYWSDRDKIQALEPVSLDDLKNYARQWRRGTQIKGLLYGNLNQEWLTPWQQSIARLHFDGDEKLIPAKIVRLDNDLRPYDIRTVEHDDHAVALYIQGASDTLFDHAAMALLRQIMRSPFYSTLRTEQQLGYIVFMGSLDVKQVPGSVFMVQSPDAEVDVISLAIERFIADFEAKFPEDIGIYQQAVVTQLLEVPTTLSASAKHYRDDLLRGNENFNYRQQLAAAVRSMTSGELLAYFRSVLPSPSHSLWQFSHPPETPGRVPFQKGENYYQYP